ncbi:MAG: diacylglycerol kinase (ATP) [Verrucomicrobiales bacterium]|jgi:diacylglycerol kinase (ATP)
MASSASEEIPVILNPRARSQRAGKLEDKIRALSPKIRILATSRAGEAREMAAQLSRDGYPKVVAAGGDGTVNEVVNGLVDAGLKDAPKLGIIPSGTMNVFARELKLHGRGFDRCWETIESSDGQPVDLWRADGHYFVQVAGIGLDADIIQHTTWDMKIRYGSLSYVLAGLRQVSAFRETVLVQADGQPDREAAYVLAGNGQLYGGPFKVFPDARTNDQLLDVVVVERHGFRSLARLLQAFTLSGYRGLPGVHYFQTRSMTVHGVGGASVPVEVDGDFSNRTPITFRCAQHPLKVLI